MSENVVIAAHVETEMDADCAIAALADAGISAAKQESAHSGSPLLAMPGAMGFGSAQGYDILVNSAAEKEAKELLIGIGTLEASEADDEAEEPAEPAETADNTQETAPEPQGKVNPLLVILFLIALALFVIGIDKVIELIKSLLM